jgi:hypothetical protein
MESSQHVLKYYYLHRPNTYNSGRKEGRKGGREGREESLMFYFFRAVTIISFH